MCQSKLKMGDKILFNRLGNRVVEEAQLLAEKKWVVHALDKVRHQRNCLQIERLHLESLKSKGETNASVSEDKTIESDINAHSRSAVNLMQCAPKTIEIGQATGMATLEEIICNGQDLDLMPHCISRNGDKQSYNMEEDEEYEVTDMVIDMNMLMNGNQK